ncbi:MAG: hypothetical protein C0620_07745 [Desulfuromonas sp.]|nr:MAG: hypothetical protein C0620_07745 [Desulfuromonas sp.]
MMSPCLFINRLVIMKNGLRVYDEPFHKGFNVIRGANGSGKSTIMDLLFFGLGGDLKDWKEHSQGCDEVFVEVMSNTVPLVLKRRIDGGKRSRPMHIYIGNYDSAMKSAADGWILAPFSRNSESRTYTQMLFESLGIQEMPGEERSNITMHQILRLIYVDQTSPLQRIFRLEPQYDSKDIREAIGDLLCGIGGSELYSARLKKRELEKRFDEVYSKLKHIIKAGSALQESLNEESLQQKIDKLNQKKSALELKLSEIENSDINSKEIGKEAEKKRVELSQHALKTKNELINDEEKLKGLDYEIEDSKSFIKHLQSMLTEFESSSRVFQFLGNVNYERCPACHGTLPKRKDDECHLCGNHQHKEDIQAKQFEVKFDLEGQITESEKLLAESINKRNDLAKKITGQKRHLSSLINRLDKIRVAPSDGRRTLIYETSCEIGRAEAQIEELEKLRGLSLEMTTLSKSKSKLQAKISSLEDKIAGYVASQERRRSTVTSAIAENTKYFLELDLAEHKDFEEDLEDFAFDFKDDWFAINGQPNISKSASGMVVVKNSLFLGLLKTAINDGEMKFPRLLLLDNVEDKGMVTDRIHNYQKIIADFCAEQDADHQIIITTSSLNEELDTPKYTVGDSYTKEHRSLRL